MSDYFKSNKVYCKAREAYGLLLIALTLMVMASCSSSKFIPPGSHLLSSAKIETDDKSINTESLEPFIRQRPNSRWFSLIKVPLAVHSLSGSDSTKWVNRTLRKIGEEPVLFDSVQANQTCTDLLAALHNMGYLEGRVDLQTRVKGKKIKVVYQLHPGTPYTIRHFDYDIEDSIVAGVLSQYINSSRGRQAEGVPFTVSSLDNERNKITSYLQNRGYFLFHKDFIDYTADSVAGQKQIDVVLHLHKYRLRSNEPDTIHPRFKVAYINYLPGDSTGLHIRRKVLEHNTAMTAHEYFSQSALNRTYNNFGRLGAVKYTNIKFVPLPGDTALGCDIKISTNKPNTISFEPEGTNTSGDLGVAAKLTYQNRNLFHGSELFTLQLRGAFEAIRGLEGYDNSNYEEYNAEMSLQLPRLVVPLLSSEFKRRQTASTEFAMSWNMQNRPEFHRRLFSAAMRYKWASKHQHTTFQLDVLDLNYVYMPWISATFKHDYLDSVSNRNAILRYNYDDLFIMKLGFGLSYHDNNNAFKANIETSGNLLYGLSRLANFKKNDEGQSTLFNIAFAQYAKFDFDYTHLFNFSGRNTLALHADFGIAYPYGNSKILPFEKRYFSGGANSVRGWSVRSLGPGKFKGTDGRIDFINHTGDMKLDLNAEMRTYLFWKFDGAFFIDAGNIWTLREYAEQPGGQFRINKFLSQMAVAYGIGIRLNLSYFILRADMGMKAVNPAYTNNREHYPIAHPDLGRDFTFHFAVGMPF